MVEITATEAARRFSGLLDEVEHAGRRFTVSRGGAPVATIGPATPRSMPISELLERLRLSPAVDERFAADVRVVRAEAGPPPTGDAWES